VKESIRKIKEKFEAWKKFMTREDDLILKYLNEGDGGTVFIEVNVGGPPGAPRRIDAVRIPTSDNKIVTFKKGENQRFKELVTGKRVEVIEVKRKLNRPVIGQSIVGADLLDIGYRPHAIKQVILCESIDPLLEKVCERRGLKGWGLRFLL
jgi:hypothetical protein